MVSVRVWADLAQRVQRHFQPDKINWRSLLRWLDAVFFWQAMEELISAFKEIVDLIGRIVSTGKSNGSLSAEEQLVTRNVIDDVHDSPTGVSPHRSHLEYSVRPTWHRASFAVIDKIKPHAPYQNLVAVAQSRFPDCRNIDEHIWHAAHVLIEDALQERSRDLQELVEHLVKDIKYEAIPAWSEIEVQGFKILTKRFEIQDGERKYTFRQPEISDFEVEMSDYAPRLPASFEMPSCFLRVDTKAKAPIELQQEARRAEVALRLFRVCSADCRKQKFGCNSATRQFFSATIGTGSWRPSSESYELKQDTLERFRAFWMKILNQMPTNIYDFAAPQTTDALKIAFDRYSDSLFHRTPLEGKLALAVMGLEALYLGREEQQELMYRLSLRASKLFSKLGYSAKNVKSQLRAGYTIRSVYVHGGHLSAKESAQIEKKVKMSLIELTRTLLDYLRMTIVFVIVTKMNKEAFLELLEESLLDGLQDKALEELMLRASPLLL